MGQTDCFQAVWQDKMTRGVLGAQGHARRRDWPRARESELHAGKREEFEGEGGVFQTGPLSSGWRRCGSAKKRQSQDAIAGGGLSGWGCLLPLGATRVAGSSVFFVQQAQADGAAPTQPGRGAVTLVAIDGLQVEQHFEHVGRAAQIAQRQWSDRVA